MDKLAVEVDVATKILPEAIKTVVKIEPGMVPNASMKIPPINGKTVLTIDTLDCRTPYCEFVIPYSYLFVFFLQQKKNIEGMTKEGKNALLLYFFNGGFHCT